MKIEFDHIGVLVRDITGAVDSLNHHDWPIGEIEEFPAEGTKEVYIGRRAASGRILLLEPIGEGPYKDALTKRGPGLHHIAINVDDAMEFSNHISGSGWYLHPKSLKTFTEHMTLWLARPGVPLLVETVKRTPVSKVERVEFVSRIEVPLPDTKPLLASALGIKQFQPSPEAEVFLTIDGERKRLRDFVVLGD